MIENLGRPRNLTPQRQTDGKLIVQPFTFFTDTKKERIKTIKNR